MKLGNIHSWHNRRVRDRCYSYVRDAGYCLRKAGHPLPHRSAEREWSEGDRTSQPIRKDKS